MTSFEIYHGVAPVILGPSIDEVTLATVYWVVFGVTAFLAFVKMAEYSSTLLRRFH